VEERLRLLSERQAQLDSAFERWAELDGMSEGD